MKLVASVSPKRITQVLVLVALCLTLASVVGQLFKYFVCHSCLFGLVSLFDVSMDLSIPTWYASFMLMLCSVLIAAIAFAKQVNHARYVVHWKVLAIIFLYLSVDEVATIHETIGLALRPVLDTSGFLYHRWVLVGAPLTLIVVLAYLKFLAHLPTKTRRLFLIAGAIFCGGALGMEMIAANHASFHGSENITYALITTLEEFLEMLGIIVFVYTLLLYISLYVKKLNVCIDHKGVLTVEPSWQRQGVDRVR